MVLLFIEALSSDEDEVDENNTSYLDNIKNFATKKASESGFEMSAEIKVQRHSFTKNTYVFISLIVQYKIGANVLIDLKLKKKNRMTKMIPMTLNFLTLT